MKKFLGYMLLMGVIFGACFGVGTMIASYFKPAGEEADSGPGTVAEGERTNILFLGVDARPGETRSRSDSIMVASIDPNLKKIALISIPRDTRVEIAGNPSEKICVANYIGGPKLAMDKVEDLLGENIDYYVEVNFSGFEKIVDTLGGVQINVEQRMYKPSEGIDLHKGEQRLNGHDALAFVRFRGYVMGDIDRTAHQQVFLKALAREVLQPKTMAKLPQLIKAAKPYIDTNLGLTDMLKMASWAPGFDENSIVAQTLPGYFYDERDAWGNLTQSFWIADSSNNGRLLNKLFSGQKVAVLVQSQTVTNVNDDGTKTGRSSASQEEADPADISPAPADDEALDWERSNLPSPGHATQG